MSRRGAIAAVLVLPAMLFVFSCRKDISTGPANVLLITVDTMRLDHIGAMGYEYVQTPNMDKLINEGVLFEQARVPVPVTLPSHASIMTGLYPPANGVRDNGSFRLTDDATTIAETFKAAGYATEAVIGAVVLDRRFGLAQGFENYDDEGFLQNGGEISFFYPERKATEVTDRAIRRIEERKKSNFGSNGKFFMWVHYYDPHAKYDPPPPYNDRYQGNPYDGEIAYTDAQIGRLLEYARKAVGKDDLIVVLMSDHGEGLWEHGELTHGMFLYDSTVRVPVVINCPTRLKPARITSRISTVDVAPTLLELVGLSGGQAMQGSSLVPLIKGEKGDRRIYMETAMPRFSYGWSELRGMAADGYTVIESPRPELYSWEDAAQENDLALSKQDRLESYLKRLGTWYKELSRPETASRARSEMSPEVRAQLAALNYLHMNVKGNDNPDVPVIGGVNPADRKYFQADLAKGNMLAAEGKYTEAAQVFSKLIENNPGSPYLYLLRGLMRDMAGDSSAAISDILTAVTSDPEYQEGFRVLGRIYLNLKEYDKAEIALARAIELYPSDAEACAMMGTLLQNKGDDEKALVFLKKAVEYAPGISETNRDMAIYLFKHGSYAEALTYIEKALEISPTDFKIILYCGKIRLKNGDRNGSISVFRQGLEKNPGVIEFQLGLGEALETGTDGVVFGQGSDIEAAREIYARTLSMEPNNKTAKAGLEAIDAELKRRGIPK